MRSPPEILKSEMAITCRPIISFKMADKPNWRIFLGKCSFIFLSTMDLVDFTIALTQATRMGYGGPRATRWAWSPWTHDRGRDKGEPQRW